jgi:hypothetical protein
VNRIITLGEALRKRPIVYFVCFENPIIIEVDGGQHAAETVRIGKELLTFNNLDLRF